MKRRVTLRDHGLATVSLALVLVAVVSLALVGCSQATATPTAGSKPAAAPATTQAPAPTPTSVPATATPVPPTATPKPLDKIAFRVNWTFNGHDAPWFTAIDRGYYKSNGLDVSVMEGRGSAATMQTVASKADTFGYITANIAAKAIEDGVPIKIVAVILQKNTWGVLSMKDKPILKPEDLRGKTLDYTIGAGTDKMLAFIMKANNIAENEVKLQTVEPTVLYTLLAEGKVDGALSQPLTASTIVSGPTGRDTATMLFGDYGMPMPSVALVAHNDTIKQNPDLVRRFVAATLKGWDDAEKDPAGVVTILRRLTTQQTSETSNIAELKADFTLLRTPRTQGQPVGRASVQDLEEGFDNMLKIGLITKRLPLSDYYTDEFLPK